MKDDPRTLSIGEIEFAKRWAMRRFDEWNDITGCVELHCGYNYELLSVIEDAVEIGLGVGCGAKNNDVRKRLRSIQGE